MYSLVQNGIIVLYIDTGYKVNAAHNKFVFVPIKFCLLVIAAHIGLLANRLQKTLPRSEGLEIHYDFDRSNRSNSETLKYVFLF